MSRLHFIRYFRWVSCEVTIRAYSSGLSRIATARRIAGIVREVVFDDARGIMMAQDDVVLDHFDDLVAVGFEIGLRVVPGLAFQRLDLVGDRAVAVVLGGLAQCFERPPRLRFVGDLLVGHEAHELLVVGIRERERAAVDPFVGTGLHVAVAEVLDESHEVERYGETAAVFRFHAHVGHDASAVVDLAASAGGVFADQRVGHLPHGALLRTGVVDDLYAAPRGDVVFGRGELQIGVVAQRTGGLHEPLAEAPLPDHDRTVEVLQRPGHDLGGRGGVAVDQDGQRQIGQDRFRGRAERFAFGPPFGRNHFGALGYEHREDFHGLLQNASAVAAVVEHEAPQVALAAQTVDRGAHVVVTPSVKSLCWM